MERTNLTRTWSYFTIGKNGALQKCKWGVSVFVKFLEKLEHFFILFVLFQNLHSLFHS